MDGEAGPTEALEVLGPDPVGLAVLLALDDETESVGRHGENIGPQVIGTADDTDVQAAITFTQERHQLLEFIRAHVGVIGQIDIFVCWVFALDAEFGGGRRRLGTGGLGPSPYGSAAISAPDDAQGRGGEHQAEKCDCPRADRRALQERLEDESYAENTAGDETECNGQLPHAETGAASWGMLPGHR
ncbi:hypothetical protein TPA0598_03_05430 [Streptomyces lydicamycinicus]|uniref:Uncharacterized protein n=1 Tax=Streptomyces lydicamycinicus TaxID=1546107 RepID=A0A0P4R507_9ACTN|nr:hypothetical protein TPA0598_03_05430 [Streptomyces lydicamycinicus]